MRKHIVFASAFSLISLSTGAADDVDNLGEGLNAAEMVEIENDWSAEYPGFDSADLDSDGYPSDDEAGRYLDEEDFASADVDHDGLLTEEEFGVFGDEGETAALNEQAAEYR